MLIFSVHGDTNFKYHTLKYLENGDIEGHMDNFAGVYCIMQAYFSGKLTMQHVRIEITYGEETNMEGAREVLKTVSSKDMVIVIDVTGAPTTKDFTIEKCMDYELLEFMEGIFETKVSETSSLDFEVSREQLRLKEKEEAEEEQKSGGPVKQFKCDIYESCPDPVCNEDETDVYRVKTPYTCFLGIPVWANSENNKNYNAGVVQTNFAKLNGIVKAIIQICDKYPEFEAKYLKKKQQDAENIVQQ